MKSAIYYFLSFFLVFACQKKEAKPSSRSLYDHAIFAEYLTTLVHDEAKFAEFKRDPFCNILWENLPKEAGDAALNRIKTQFPHLLNKLDALRESDKIGSPRTYHFGTVGSFSPSTLHFVSIAGDLQKRLGGFAEKTIIQVGSGYGGLCKILHTVQSCKSYTLVDLPEQLALAKKYLESFGLTHIIYRTFEDLPKDAEYDCVISDRTFSELNSTYQKLILDRIFANSHAGYILGHVFSKHFGVTVLSINEIKKNFEKSGAFSKWEFQQPTIEKENYFIFWQRS